MQKTNQTPQQTVWEHGTAVSERYVDLVDNLLLSKEPRFTWRKPTWDDHLVEYALRNQADRHTAQLYQQWHDCGKPYCMQIDKEGKAHFPDHASVSFQTFSRIFPEQRDAAQMVLHDMDVHLAKSADVDLIASLKDAPTLVLTALSEVHANADMFGGLESTSFKIKWKQVNKRGRQILTKHMNNNQSKNR